MGSIGRLLTVEKDGEIIAGVRAVSVSWASESIDLSQGEPDGYRFLAEIDGLETISLSVEGVTKTDLIRNIAYSRAESRLLENITITWPPMVEGEIPATLQGSFFIDAYSEDAPYNDAYTFTMTLNSSALIDSGEIVSGGYIYTPGFVAPGGEWGPLEQALGLSMFAVRKMYSDGTNFIAISLNDLTARSTDGGISWTALNNGLDNGFGTNGRDIIYSDGVWVSVWNLGGASRSTDGVNWSPLTRGLNNGFDVAASATGIASNGAGKFIVVYDDNYTAESLDDGLTWGGRGRGFGLPQSPGVPPDDDFNCISCNQLGVWMAGHDSGDAARSVDDGVTWEVMIRGLNNGSGVNQPIYTMENNGGSVWLAGQGPGWISRSADNGATWSDVFINTSEIINVIFYQDGAFFVGCDNSVSFRSIDNGQTFEQMEDGLNSGVLPGVPRDLYCFAGSDNEIIATFAATYVAVTPPL